MIVCVCRGVNDRQIGEAIQRGAFTLDEITRRCQGAGSDCGSCRSDIAVQLAECSPGKPARAA
jgi:bacterioferritin-associated ferredoxin